ncbi:M15 family metallopeptidase [Oerskovia sp. Sa1BUA8]|uniref:M15 family metallopeptidase n=1 Tax=Oerskovia douganii TaxID=2762210 RepID=A0A9D5U7T1_9CELL|nr:M15 family metallopeptidase [Oerskovia douganii]MBE7700098.1 M15 family metallopeptidase [Oerskovia douganii]
MTFDSPPLPPPAPGPWDAHPGGRAPTGTVPPFDSLLAAPDGRPRAGGGARDAGRGRGPGRARESGRAPGRPARRRRTPADRVYAAVVVIGLVACGVSAYELTTDSSSTDPSTGTASGRAPGAGPGAAVGEAAEGPAGEAPATGLDLELQRRFEQARALAAEDGVELTLVSGWRSAQEQEQVVEDVVRKRGSREEAKRWVLPPEASAHVAGTAIDVGATEGALWLGQHGEELGLCRTYANEMWHFEAVTEPGGTCPPMHEDSRVGWE